MGSLMLVPGKVINLKNGKSIDVTFQIDTGADASVIDLSFAREIDATPSEWVMILDVDGTPIAAPVFTLMLILDNCDLGTVKLVGLNLPGGRQGLIGNDILDRGLLVRDGRMKQWFFMINDGACGSCGSIFQMETTDESNDNKWLYAFGALGVLLGTFGLLFLTKQK